jgi:uncharacterized protein (DUF433 family)
MSTSVKYDPIIGDGVYSYRQAARLLSVTSQRVRRWAEGYTYQVKFGLKRARPVLQSRQHIRGILSFPELFELFFVKEFVALGVQLPQVRRASEWLAERCGEFPFTNSEVFVEGGKVIASIGEVLVEAASAQSMFHYADVARLVADFAKQMRRKIEFVDDRVVRYYPAVERIVYLDRRIRMGEPVAGKHAVPTRAIYDLWKAEQDLNAVKSYFDLSETVVSAAIRFEGELTLAA